MQETRPARWYDPACVQDNYRAGVRHKTALGDRGLYRQNQLNERFYAGDHWHGAASGDDRPLVRHNLIRRIGEYKMAVVGAGPLSVNFSADGLPDTVSTRARTHALKQAASAGALPALAGGEADALTLSALSGYFRATAERLRLDSLNERVLKNAYCTGTGVLYTYWDDTVPTGLFADEARTLPLTGDIACQVLDIDQVYFGDPTEESVEAQPYLLITQRRTVAELRRMAKAAGRPAAEIEEIRPDREGQPPDGEPEDAGKALLITKFYKAPDSPTVWAVQVCGSVTVRAPWDLRLRRYPLSVFRWETRPNSAYGNSEITWLIPNQIAVNRMLTASVWSVLMQGMPTLLVNGDVIEGQVTNDPGQVIRVFGTGDDLDSAMRYVEPPAFSAEISATVNDLIAQTLGQSGATSAALGDVEPHNTSAIVAAREAAMLPLERIRDRWFAYVEDVARMWAEFWVSAYSDRPLRVEDEWGSWYLPFDGDRLRQLSLRARVDVGAAGLWSESQSIVTLDNLLNRGIITPAQYLKRLPAGTVPDVEGLLREMGEEVTP